MQQGSARHKIIDAGCLTSSQKLSKKQIGAIKARLRIGGTEKGKPDFIFY